MRFRKIVRRTLPVGLALFSVLATAAPAARASTSSAKPVSGGTYTALVTFENATYDPIQVSAGSSLAGAARPAYAVYDALAYVDTSKGGEVVFKTAQSFTSSDGLNWTVKLRPNIKFTDGTAYDAAAVMFNWQRLIDNPGQHQLNAQTIASMQVVDPVTLKVTLKAANGQFPRIAAADLTWIASPTALRTYGSRYGTTPDTTVGAGPFVMKEFIRQSKVAFDRNPNYWQKGKPYLDRLVMNYVTDQAQQINTMLVGQADEISSGTSWQASQVDQVKAVGNPFSLPLPNWVGLWAVLNTTTAPFNDVRARKAVQLAIDWKRFANVIYGGASYTLDYHMFREGSPFYDKDTTYPKYNKAGAQKLFDEYFTSTGKDVEINLVHGASVTNWGEFLTAMFREYNHVKISDNTVIGAQAFAVLQTKNFGMSFAPFTGYDPEPVMYELFYSKGFRNFQGYTNTAVDAALDQGRASVNEKERASAYQKAQKQIFADQAGVFNPVLTSSPNMVVSKRVQNFVSTLGYPLYDQIWFKKS